MTADLYEILGVQRDATTAEIHAAFRKLSKLHHPDKGGDREEFERMKLADDVLTDEARRAAYDETGDTGEQMGDERINSEAIATLSSVLGLALSEFDARHAMGGGDLLVIMKRLLGTKLDEIKKDRAKCETEADKMERIKKKITVKTGENHLAKLLDRGIQAAQASVKGADIALRIGNRTMEMLETYDFAADPILAPTAADVRQYAAHTHRQSEFYPNHFNWPGR